MNIDYNRSYFSKIDSPQKAYWIGFILGDGNLQEYTLEISLASKDKQILYNFIEEIGGSKEQVKDRKKYNSNRLTLSSKQMVNDLINLGIPAKHKTFTAKPITTPYPSAFWLGLFDADGYVGIYQRKDRAYYKKRINISLVGTKRICIGFSKFIGSYGRRVYNRGNYWTFLNGNNSIAIKVYFKLYKHNIPCLNRKKEIFEKWIEENAE